MWLRSGPTAGSQNKPSFFTKGRVYSWQAELYWLNTGSHPSSSLVVKHTNSSLRTILAEFPSLP
jgi:hypothetical protein